MDGLHGTDACFSPARAMSPQVRPPGPPDVGSQYLADLLQEHQKLGPFMQVLPICSRLLNQEIMRVSNMRRQHGAGEFEKFPIASPNQMHPSPPMPNFCGNSYSPWNGMHSEACSHIIKETNLSISIINYIHKKLGLLEKCPHDFASREGSAEPFREVLARLASTRVRARVDSQLGALPIKPFLGSLNIK